MKRYYYGGNRQKYSLIFSFPFMSTLNSHRLAGRKPALLGMLALLILSVATGCEKDNGSQPQTIAAAAASSDVTGTSGGFYWQCYNANNKGSATLTNGTAGNFSVSYSNVDDVVAGKGWSTGSTRTIGYNVGSLSGSYNSVGVYGWTKSPLIEYYVNEFGSAYTGNATRVNTVSSDGHTYTFYKHQQVNQPSIIGTATFWQYLDNWGGSSTGSNRSINMANHINNWKSSGGQGFGSYDYQIFSLEAYGNKSGYINATVW